jgi:3-hydroxymyristoyl/3-hydroxydecanoyl-(acyl carrier protein) dehydratase
MQWRNCLSQPNNIDPVIRNVKSVESGVVLSLDVLEELTYFEGHFPQSPILAGVVQLDWAIKLAKQYLSLDTSMSVQNVEVLKFMEVITPGMSLTLTLTQKSEHKFIFKYESEQGTHASGRVVLRGA